MLYFLILAFLGWFRAVESSDIMRSACEISVTKCEHVQNKDCFGASLPYQQTAPGAFTGDVVRQNEIRARLQLWSALRRVPQCWEVIQLLLCSVYLPRCKFDGMANVSLVQKPSRELCDLVQTRCRIVELYGGWPEFLKCHQKHFSKGCLTNMLLVKVNDSKSCFPPLVLTKSEMSWYPYVDGCGLQCENVLFTEADHAHAHVFIAVTGVLSFFCTLFTVLTFILDWKSLHRYPAIILFFVNVSFLIGTAGWLAQLIPGTRRDIVCRNDGTVRRAEPQIGSSGESASCTVMFVIIYYFTMAGVIWFAILAYTWDLTFRTFNSKRDVIEGRKGYFHLVAWSLPLVLTIVCLAVTGVDGDSVSGICFVGYASHAYRILFVLLPVGLCATGGLVFLVRGLTTLIKLKTQSPGLITNEAAAHIRATIVRISVFAPCVLVLVVLTIAIHIYEFVNESTWQLALRDYLVCMANSTAVTSSVVTADCHMSSRPSLLIAELHVVTYFCAGVVMSSWIWQKSTIIAWKRYLKKWFCAPPMESNCETKMMIHKLDPMAVAGQRNKSRQRDPNVARSSLSFVGLGDDPFGRKSDLTSVSSRDFSSTWSAALPYGMHHGSRVPTPLMLQHGAFGRLHRRHSESDLESVTSIWPSQHDQPTANVMIHSPPSDDQSSRPGTTASSVAHQPTDQSSTDSQQSARKRKNIRQLLSSRIAPMCLYSDTTDTDDSTNRQRQPDLPVYSKLVASSGQMQAAECGTSDAGVVGSAESVAAETTKSTNSQIRSAIHSKNDRSDAAEGEGEDDDSTVAAESECCSKGLSDNSAAASCAGELVSNNTEDVDSDTDIHSNSNYSIASSDTAALSIKLDENYDPIMEQPGSETVTEPEPPPAAKVSAAKAVVRPLEARRSNIPILRASASLPTSAATSKSNSATQTSIVQPPLGYYQQPFPYPMFGYGGYLPPLPAVCETPIWPPFAYPPPLPWYYYGPHYDPLQYMPMAPPYSVVPPSATAASNSNQCTVPTDIHSNYSIASSDTAALSIKHRPSDTGSGVPDSQPTVTVEPSKPTMVPPSSFRKPTASSADKLFRPIASRSCFQPTAGSLFKPVTQSDNSGCRQVSQSEPVVDEKLSRSLLEMVQLITPEFDSGSEHASGKLELEDDNDDAEDETEREAWEAEERERQRIRRRHTRQWMRALQTDVDHTQFSDTSL